MKVDGKNTHFEILAIDPIFKKTKEKTIKKHIDFLSLLRDKVYRFFKSKISFFYVIKIIKLFLVQ